MPGPQQANRPRPRPQPRSQPRPRPQPKEQKNKTLVLWKRHTLPATQESEAGGSQIQDLPGSIPAWAI